MFENYPKSLIFANKTIFVKIKGFLKFSVRNDKSKNFGRNFQTLYTSGVSVTGVSTAVDICRATFRLSTGAAISSSAVFWLSVSTDASAKLDFFKWILKQVGKNYFSVTK